MSHKDAPPETAEQAACRAWWQARLGSTSVGWGRAKGGNFLAAFAADAQAAWDEARAQAEREAWADAQRERSSYHHAWTQVIETATEHAGDELSAQRGTNIDRVLALLRGLGPLRQAAQAVADALDMPDGPTPAEITALNNALAPFTAGAPA